MDTILDNTLLLHCICAVTLYMTLEIITYLGNLCLKKSLQHKNAKLYLEYKNKFADTLQIMQLINPELYTTNISQDVKIKLFSLFEEIFPVLLSYKNGTLQHISFSYILFRCFNMLNMKDCAIFYNVLHPHSRSKRSHNKLWNNICNELNWEF